MSEEELKKIINTIAGIDVQSEAEAIAKEKLMSYVEQLQQESGNLKEKLDISETNYDIIYCYFAQINKLLGTELCEEVLNKIIQLQQENKELKIKLEKNTKIYLNTSKYASEMESKYVLVNYILTEFEKWLEKYKKDEMFDYGNEQLNNYFNEFCDMALEELQELKEGKK